QADRIYPGVTILGVDIGRLVIAIDHEADRIYPGVTILGVDIGRLKQEEASRAITQHLTEQSRRPFALRYDNDAFTTSLATLGVKIDSAEVQQWVAQAWSVGRDGDFHSWLRSQLVLLRRGYELPITLTFDRRQAAAVLGRLAMDVERQPVNANLSVERAGEQFEIHTTPAQTGRRLNVEATLDQLQASLINAMPIGVDIVLDEARPAIADADIAPAAERIQAMLGSPIELRDGTRTWTLTPATTHGMLEIAGLQEGVPPVEPRLNEAKLRAFVEGVARQADQPARNPTFDIQGDQVVVRQGTPGKLTDVNATLERVKEQIVSPNRTVELVFAEDKPWLSETDLEPARVQANSLLDLPLTLEAPPLTAGENRTWVLDRATLSQMLVLPNTQSVPREYATLPPSARPSFEIQLDSGKVTNFLAREVAPWVSEDPVDAQLELRRPSENRPMVELRYAKDGRGPDYLATFSAMQIIFKNGSAIDPADRKVLVRTAARPPRVQDQHLIPARDMANRLIGEPVTLRWNQLSWTVTRDELAAMLRYQPTNSGQTAYLAREGLISKATAVARELERHPSGPRDSAGNPRTVDIPATASALWLQASTAGAERVATIVLEELPEPLAPSPTEVASSD
ncbi:MAG TPA: peptidoglycan binding domain-containing protein, partial [Chloroflexota bacterium]|nr:peptidoglycan binding domain-containing protein [Chloroflexota bacterium]